MSVILSLYPNSRGIGYVCLEFPGTIYDFAMIGIKPISNAKVLQRVEKFIKVLRPSVIVVRDNAPTTGRGKRIEQLRNEIEEHAKCADIPIYSYTREQVKDVFELFGARNKQEIAEWIGTHFHALTDKIPKQKKFYEAEDFNMGIFAAMALALTHEYLSK